MYSLNPSVIFPSHNQFLYPYSTQFSMMQHPCLRAATILCLHLSIPKAAATPRLSVYGEVLGLDPSPFYRCRVREAGDAEWIDTFSLLPECSLETFCNTTGFYNSLGNLEQ
jgi:hypothetical protein